MLSRKHYRAIASIIKDNTMHNSNGSKTLVNDDEVLFKDSLINDLTMYFQSDNKYFSCERFVNACDE